MEARTDERARSPVATQDNWRAGLWRTLRTRAYGILSDETLILRARARDYMAFDALVARYRDRIYTMALGYLGSEDKTLDALGEMESSASRDIGSFEAKRSPGSWLYLHGLRAVFKRMNAPVGRYAIGSGPAADGDPRRDD